jgi:hypothetical protein
MSKSNATETDTLNIFFLKTLASWMGTLATTGDANATIALHTADPGEGGTQSTNEATYTSYARVNVIRTVAGWTVSGNTAQNAALIQFPEATGGTDIITYVSIGINSGQIMYSGALTASRTISTGIQPQFAINSLTVTED